MPEMSARDYLMLPWSIRGPIRATDDHGNVHYEMRVSELPDFFVAADSENDVLYEFKKALLAFIESYTNEGEEPPVPVGDPIAYVPLPRPESRHPIRLPPESKSASGLEPADLVSTP